MEPEPTRATRIIRTTSFVRVLSLRATKIAGNPESRIRNQGGPAYTGRVASSSKSALWLTLTLLIAGLAAPAGWLVWKRDRDRRVAANEGAAEAALMEVGVALETVEIYRRIGTL